MADGNTDTQSPTFAPDTTQKLKNSNQGDCYGSSTTAFGTEILKIIPGLSGHAVKINNFPLIENGSTTQTITIPISIDSTVAQDDAAAGQVSITLGATLSGIVPGVIAAGDIIATVNVVGQSCVYKVAGYTPATRLVTVTLSVGSADGSGFVYKIARGAPVYFFGAPGDWPDRQFRIPASFQNALSTVGSGLAAGASGEPLIIHCNNATANIYIAGPAFEYVPMA